METVEVGRPLVGLVDDDRIFRFAAERFLMATSMVGTVIHHEHGLAAVDYLQQHHDQADRLPDLMFIDLFMPVLDGWGFLERYAALRPTLARIPHIVVLTSSIDERDVRRASSIDIVDRYVCKPVSTAIFAATLQGLGYTPLMP